MSVVRMTVPAAGLTTQTTAELGRRLPRWSSALVVVAHPDDESFGLGGVVASMTSAGADVHVLCFTHGEASTLNETGAELRRAREAELREAGAELGVRSVTLLDYPDGGLSEVDPAELAGRVREIAALVGAEGLLVFDESGITGHSDHQAATAAALRVPGLPVLAWALTEPIARRLRAETGQPFAGRWGWELDLVICADRVSQRAAALRHATQVSPGAVLWRRLEMQGNEEYLRWLRIAAVPESGTSAAAGPDRLGAGRP